MHYTERQRQYLRSRIKADMEPGQRIANYRDVVDFFAQTRDDAAAWDKLTKNMTAAKRLMEETGFPAADTAIIDNFIVAIDDAKDILLEWLDMKSGSGVDALEKLWNLKEGDLDY